jgi:hypothetical protein
VVSAAVGNRVVPDKIHEAAFTHGFAHAPLSALVIGLSRTQLETLASDKGTSGTPCTRTSSCTASRINRRRRASNVSYESTRASRVDYGLRGRPRITRGRRR